MLTASPKGAGALALIRGEETMRRSIGLASVERLFDEHYRSFGFDGELLKRSTISELLDRTSWPNAIDAFLDAARAEPTNSDYKHALALALEHVGQIAHATTLRHEIAEAAPSWFTNNISIGRLSELSGLIDEARAYYAHVCTTVAAHSLAIARSVAINGPRILNDMTLRDLQGKLKFSSSDDYDDMTVNLAAGFICVAKGDRSGARRYFGLACSLARQKEMENRDRSGAPKNANYDEWSLAYARIFLLDLVPKERNAVPIFVEFNPAALALACTSSHSLSDEGSLAMAQYAAAVSELLSPTANENYRIVQDYRIALHDNRYYAIPNSVTGFKFVQGFVLPASPGIGGGLPGWTNVIPNRRLLQIKYGAKKLLRLVLAIVGRIPGAKRAGKAMIRATLNFYARRRQIKGVITAADYNSLHERISGERTAREGAEG